MASRIQIVEKKMITFD